MEGHCYITTGTSNYLNDYHGSAVVGLESPKHWSLKSHGDPKDPHPKFIFVCHTDGATDSVEQVLTLVEESNNESWINIVTSPQVDPISKAQLWTLEGVEQDSESRVVKSRIQSVTKPEYVMAIGGVEVLPRLYLNVAALRNDPAVESQNWVFKYFDPAK